MGCGEQNVRIVPCGSMSARAIEMPCLSQPNVMTRNMRGEARDFRQNMSGGPTASARASSTIGMARAQRASKPISSA